MYGDGVDLPTSAATTPEPNYIKIKSSTGLTLNPRTDTNAVIDTETNGKLKDSLSVIRKDINDLKNKPAGSTGLSIDNLGDGLSLDDDKKLKVDLDQKSLYIDENGSVGIQLSRCGMHLGAQLRGLKIFEKGADKDGGGTAGLGVNIGDGLCYSADAGNREGLIKIYADPSCFTFNDDDPYIGDYGFTRALTLSENFLENFIGEGLHLNSSNLLTLDSEILNPENSSIPNSSYISEDVIGQGLAFDTAEILSKGESKSTGWVSAGHYWADPYSTEKKIHVNIRETFDDYDKNVSPASGLYFDEEHGGGLAIAAGPGLSLDISNGPTTNVMTALHVRLGDALSFDEYSDAINVRAGKGLWIGDYGFEPKYQDCIHLNVAYQQGLDFNNSGELTLKLDPSCGLKINSKGELTLDIDTLYNLLKDKEAAENPKG